MPTARRRRITSPKPSTSVPCEVLNAAIDGHNPAAVACPSSGTLPGWKVALYSDFGLRLPVQQWLDDDEKLY